MFWVSNLPIDVNGPLGDSLPASSSNVFRFTSFVSGTRTVKVSKRAGRPSLKANTPSPPSTHTPLSSSPSIRCAQSALAAATPSPPFWADRRFVRPAAGWFAGTAAGGAVVDGGLATAVDAGVPAAAVTPEVAPLAAAMGAGSND